MCGLDDAYGRLNRTPLLKPIANAGTGAPSRSTKASNARRRPSTARMTKPKAVRASRAPGLAHGGREAIAEAAVGGHEDDGQIRLVNHDGAEPFEAVCCMAAGGQAVVEGEGSFVPPWAA